ncbi:F-box only protein 33-like [Saccoglossus kowalevskii]|uniref:F-box only protein 33-like n=1 Tax=Saccoglossus kowalevskii TaxID=10224 RepID=A0ABM0MFZ4_SACKO|nr:PREDICTED: F-box only protein 33-like [Saccoglossus kowalevskii]
MNSTWRAVRKRNAQLRVSLTFTRETRSDDMESILKPDIPLASVTFLRYFTMTLQCLRLLVTNYTSVLESYEDLSETYDLDEELVLLSQKCTQLSRFIHRGHINAYTVLSVAKAMGRKCKRFEVDGKLISFENLGEDTICPFREREAKEMVDVDVDIHSLKERVADLIGTRLTI